MKYIICITASFLQILAVERGSGHLVIGDKNELIESGSSESDSSSDLSDNESVPSKTVVKFKTKLLELDSQGKETNKLKYTEFRCMRHKELESVKSPGNCKRPVQRYNAAIIRINHAEKQDKYNITKLNLTHNHEVSKELFDHDANEATRPKDNEPEIIEQQSQSQIIKFAELLEMILINKKTTKLIMAKKSKCLESMILLDGNKFPKRSILLYNDLRDSCFQFLDYFDEDGFEMLRSVIHSIDTNCFCAKCKCPIVDENHDSITCDYCYKEVISNVPRDFCRSTSRKKEVDSEKSDNEEKKEWQEELAEETKPVGQVAFDQDALVKLCGSQRKLKGFDSIELLEVGVSEIVRNSRSEVIKQITSDYRHPFNKDYLGSTSMKTNNVPYLAKVAIQRGIEGVRIMSSFFTLLGLGLGPAMAELITMILSIFFPINCSLFT
ncbi:hypothetical protein BpHYR1_030003 [Brachionus plicatilis]|uniref:Uncharacterized protein n=1 Tax=Brachionus plicatilis TaxID=10195 RepID=A0A3M7QTU4_BRAPC|nr:hypothetical protein BpHYR1_030003 [Brachionus plicatilis]